MPTPCPAPHIRACMIDLDGTLVDTLGDFAVALNAMLHTLGRAPLAPERIALMVGKGSEHLVQSALAEQPQAQAVPLARALALYQAAYAPINGQHSRVYPGVMAGLQALRAMGLPLVCLTNKPLALAQPLLEAKGLAGYFGHVFGGDSFARKKPDPLPLVQTCQTLGLDCGHVLMVGDSQNDAQAAHAAGCPLALVRYGYNHGQPVDPMPAHWHVNSLEEVAAALQGQ